MGTDTDTKGATPADNDKGATPDPTPDPSLGDAGARALAAERKARRDADATAKALQDRLDAIEAEGKSELTKAQDRATAAEARADAAEGRVRRLEVALDKGLTKSHAARLVGATQEELEADADDLLASFGTKPTGDAGGDADTNGAPSTTTRPTPDLKPGGGGGTEPAADTRSVVDSIPRSSF